MNQIRSFSMIWLILLCAIGIPSFAQNLSSKSSVRFPFLDATIERIMKEKKVPGIAVAFVEGNQGFLFSYGVADETSRTPVTPNTLFALASITKVFTSTELALLISRKKTSLENPVTNYLPGLDRSNFPINRVTLEQLATHTSSLPRSLPPAYTQRTLTYPKLINFLRTWQPDYPIGTHYLYSNFGFGLLGLVEENLGHQPYQRLIQRDILLPLGMNSTTLEMETGIKSHYAQRYSPEGKPVPKPSKAALPASGALWSTGSDMLKFLKANLGLDGPKELLHAMQLAQEPYFKVRPALTLGLAWQKVQANGYLLIDKNGGIPGFSSYIGMVPTKKIGIVILVNKAKVNATKIGREILQQWGNSIP